MTDSDTDVRPQIGAGEPPVDADLPGRLAATAPRRWQNRATPVLLAVALLAAGFLGGVQVQQRWGKATGTTAAPTTTTSAGARTGGVPGVGASGFPAGGFPSGGGPDGNQPGAGQPGGSQPGGTAAAVTTTGTIKSISTGVLTVTTATGATVTVRIGDATSIGTATTLARLRTGQSVTVQGNTVTDGSVLASAVTAS